MGIDGEVVIVLQVRKFVMPAAFEAALKDCVFRLVTLTQECMWPGRRFR